jgi:hypothetical protein
VNITETQKFIATTIGGAAAVILGALCYTDPPLLSFPEPWGILLIAAGFAMFGVQVSTGVAGVRTKDALIELASEANSEVKPYLPEEYAKHIDD